VRGSVEDVLERPALDDLAGVHHGDAVAHAGDDAEVVRDEDDAHPALGLDVPEQVEDLRLDGDVQRGRRLVGEQDVGLAGEPDVLFADEPTTALDVTIQAQILDLLRDIQAERGMSVVLITHDLGVIARMCDRVAVMYAGEVVERGSLEDVFDAPTHPYTQGLLGSIPDVEDPAPRLQPIEGNVPNLVDGEMGDRCYFADRCPKAMEACLERPAERAVDGDPDHSARCVLADGEYDPATALDDDHFEEARDR